MSLGTDTTDIVTDRFAVPTVSIWPLSVEQYHEMTRSGRLSEDEPVELLDGWLVRKMPKNPAHCLSTGLVREALQQVSPKEWYVDSQEPITLSTSEPEPDVSLVRGQRRDFADRHPGPTEVSLVVEVADSSLERDRLVKRPLYAKAGIPVYWIVNLVDRCVEVYTEPTGLREEPDYRQRRIFRESESLPLWIEGREVARLDVQRLLP